MEKSSTKLYLPNWSKMLTIKSLRFGWRLRPNNVVLRPPPSPTNQSHAETNKEESPNSKANLENSLAAH